MHAQQASSKDAAERRTDSKAGLGLTAAELESLRNILNKFDVEDDYDVVKLDKSPSATMLDVRSGYSTPQAFEPVGGKVALGTTGHCFEHVCAAAGVLVPPDTKRVYDVPTLELNALASKKQFKVMMFVYAKRDVRNHLVLVHGDAKSATLDLVPKSEEVGSVVLCCTTMEHFFNKSNQWAMHEYYADEGNDTTFGQDRLYQSMGATNVQPTGNPIAIAPPSVHGDSIGPGGSNISGGVVRATRRVVAARKAAVTAGVQKNYRTSNVIQFNNLDEIYQDSISREYAQEVIEALFDTWGVPTDQPAAMRYAEDLLWGFMVGTTASNKADWSRAFTIPVEPVIRHGESVSEIEVSMSVFSVLLESKFGISRRQFARGVADDQRAYLKHEDNVFLLPQLATRIGCEPMLAYLAFDGSTHCSGMTTREVHFTKTLESRALFERDDVIAEGASDRLMQGFSGGIRSKVPR